MAKGVFIDRAKMRKIPDFPAPAGESPGESLGRTRPDAKPEMGDATTRSVPEWGTKPRDRGTFRMSRYTIDTVFSLMIWAGKSGRRGIA